ncbi:membrane protein, putative [Celeribacter marinus]|uniref:Membrane protein, putative n=2 Tax=Celeribacter marinus TaxID=1397108 RepID=A0A0P0A846_9RHOB|nr:membrane protein, putative [Celeribacter marinus]
MIRLTEKLRQLARSDEQRVARNRLLSLMQSVVGIGTYFLVMRYVLAVAGLGGVGLWSLTMGFVAFIRVMDLTGAGGLARMVALNPDNERLRSEYVDTVTAFIVALYAVLSMIAYLPLRYAMAGSVAPGTEIIAHALLVWAMISLPLNVAGMAQLSAIDGLGRADIRSMLNIAGFVLYGLLAAILVSSQGILGLAYAQIAQYALLLVASRVVLTRRLPSLRLVPSRFSRKAAGQALHYGFRLQASSIPMSLFDPLTRVVLGRWIGLEALGIYDLSYKLAGNVRTLLQAGMNPFLPEFARLWSTDKAAARAHHAMVSARAIRTVAIAYTVLILATPAFSLFFLSQVSAEFFFSVAVLSLGWGVASVGLATQLFARAAGALRWSIAGQWLLLMLGAALVYLATRSYEFIYVAIAVAIAIATGHMVAFAGETRMLTLTPFGTGKQAITSLAALAGFVAIAALAAGAVVMMGNW